MKEITVKYHCDICNKELPYRNILKTWRGFSGFIFGFKVGNIEYDLCEECYADLIKTLRDKKKRSVRGESSRHIYII